VSFHIITVSKAGSKLSVNRGLLICSSKDSEDKFIVLKDVRAIICLTPKLLFTGESISRIIENEGIILHCNENYQLVGLSAAEDKVIRGELFHNQISKNTEFQDLLWEKILRGKISNQFKTLERVSPKHKLWHLLEGEKLDESNSARWYWEHYFTGLGHPELIREKKNAEHFINKALNYGYGIIRGLIHRSSLIYGLCPNLGFHHKSRYRATPLIYDLMEVFRPFVDLIFIHFIQNELKSTKEEILWQRWIQRFMNSLREMRVEDEQKKNYKLMDALDIYVRQFAKCFEDEYFKYLKLNPLWIPDVNKHYYLKDEE
jgi:CRISPR-associated protein Cas1